VLNSFTAYFCRRHEWRVKQPLAGVRLVSGDTSREQSSVDRRLVHARQVITGVDIIVFELIGAVILSLCVWFADFEASRPTRWPLAVILSNMRHVYVIFVHDTFFQLVFPFVWFSLKKANEYNGESVRWLRPLLRSTNNLCMHRAVCVTLSRTLDMRQFSDVKWATRCFIHRYSCMHIPLRTVKAAWTIYYLSQETQRQSRDYVICFT